MAGVWPQQIPELPLQCCTLLLVLLFLDLVLIADLDAPAAML